MGGFLLAFLTVKELEKSKGKFKYIQALALRYLRLTPSLAFVMMLYIMIWPHLGRGPFVPRFQNSIYRRCDGSWLSELTYTMNFIPFDSDNVCMGWTWYLGDDMIFFIFGILLIPLHFKNQTLGWAAASTLIAVSCGISIYEINLHHLETYYLGSGYANYSYWLYSKPYHRIPAFLVGLAAAWILIKVEEKGITPQTGMCRPITATFLWFFAFGLLAYITLVPLGNQGLHAHSWSSVTNIIYMTFSRLAWSCGWALITFLCYFEHTPKTDAFLSHRFWTPFARLTYGAYLCHPLVIKLTAARSVQYYTFCGTNLVQSWCYNVIAAYILSLFVWCLVERPMMTLTSAAIKSTRHKTPNTNQLRGSDHFEMLDTRNYINRAQ